MRPAGTFYLARGSPLENFFSSDMLYLFNLGATRVPYLLNQNARKCWLCLETHACEAGFSAMNNIKSKKRNSLTDKHLENLMRAAVTQYQPQINRVAATLQSQISR